MKKKNIRAKKKDMGKTRVLSSVKKLPKEIAKSGAKNAAHTAKEVDISKMLQGQDENANVEAKAVRAYSTTAEDGARYIGGKSITMGKYTAKQAKKVYARRKSRKAEREEKAREQRDGENAMPMENAEHADDGKRDERRKHTGRGKASTSRADAKRSEKSRAGDNKIRSKPRRSSYDMLGNTRSKGKTARNTAKNGILKTARGAAMLRQETTAIRDNHGEEAAAHAADTHTKLSTFMLRGTVDKTWKSGRYAIHHAGRRIARHTPKTRKKDTSANRRVQHNADAKAEHHYGSTRKAKGNTRPSEAAKGAQAPSIGSLREKRNQDIRIAQRDIKTPDHAMRQGQRQIRTAQQYTKAQQKAVKQAHKSAEMIKHSAVLKAKKEQNTIKTAARRAKQLLLELVKAARMLLSALAAVTPFILLIVVLLSLIVAIMASPFGVFFSMNDTKNPPLSQIVRDIDDECINKILGMQTGFDPDDVVIDGEHDGDLGGYWLEIIPLFAVKTTTDALNGMDVVTLDDERQRILRDVFWDMVRLERDTRTVYVEREVDLGDGQIVIESLPKTELVITLHIKDAQQQAQDYGFTDQQMKMLEEAMSTEFQLLLMKLLGMENLSGLTPEELQNLYGNLPPGELGSEIVKTAFRKLGDPYDYGHGSGGGVGKKADCSAFTRWVHAEHGISIPRTAAEQGKFCVDNGLTISFSDLQPGDLIFFSHDKNGRFMNITHVAIYAGNGMIIDSSSSKGKVVHRKLYSGQVLYGRAHLK